MTRAPPYDTQNYSVDTGAKLRQEYMGPKKRVYRLNASRVWPFAVISWAENNNRHFILCTCEVSANARRIWGTMLVFLIALLPLLWGLTHTATIPKPVSLAAPGSNLTLAGATFPRLNAT